MLWCPLEKPYAEDQQCITMTHKLTNIQTGWPPVEFPKVQSMLIWGISNRPKHIFSSNMLWTVVQSMLIWGFSNRPKHIVFAQYALDSGKACWFGGFQTVQSIFKMLCPTILYLGWCDMVQGYCDMVPTNERSTSCHQPEHVIHTVQPVRLFAIDSPLTKNYCLADVTWFQNTIT